MPVMFSLDSAFQAVLACAVKGSLLLIAACAAAALLRRASAALRHLVWTSALVALLILPLFVMVAPALIPPSVQPAAPVWLSNPAALLPGPDAADGAMVVDAAAGGGGGPWRSALSLVWMAGALTIAAMLVGGAVRVCGILSRSSEWRPRWNRRLWSDLRARFGLGSSVILRKAEEPCMPFTWGVWRPRVVLPGWVDGWSEEQLRSILTHELAHVRRRDWLAQIAGEICRAVYWFHPLVWFACAQLRKESEVASDDIALAAGIDGPVYAGHVLEVARAFQVSNEAPHVVLAMARLSNLERRFVSMLNPNTDRSSVRFRTACFIIGAVILLVSSLAAMPGQTPGLSGKFFGTVYDPSGGVIPNATVVLKNEPAGTKDMTTTSAAGVFEFAGVPAGEYALEVTAGGFKRYSQSGVLLEAGRGRHETITLEAGSVSERIDVIGDAPSARTEKAEDIPGGKAIRVGGKVQAMKVRKMARPAYPAVAKSSGIEGTVMLNGVIGKDGSVQSLRVMNTQIDPDLAKAAVEAISKWVYEPTLLNGEPVAVATEIAVNFALAK